MREAERPDWRLLAIPLLFALYRPIGFYEHNADQMTLVDLGSIALIACAAAVVLTAVVFTITRRNVVTALLVSGVFIGFYSYGAVYDVLVLLGLGDTGAGTVVPYIADLIVLVVYAGLAAAAYFLLRGKPKAQRDTLKVVTVAGVALVGVTVAMAAYAFVSVGRVSSNQTSAARPAIGGEAPLRSAAATSSPDIYYIVLDSYVGRGAMLEETGYDDEALYEALRQRGFTAREDAFSNYAVTYLSLASVLNMEYLDKYTSVPGAKGQSPTVKVNRQVFYDMIGSSAVAKFLREHGYTYVHVSSGWSATAASPIADRTILTSVNDELSSAFLDTTALRPFAQRRSESLQRERTISGFQALSTVGATEHPVFLFAHFISPHPPYVFRADGTMPDWAGATGADASVTAQAYSEQARYLGSQLLRSIDAIRAAARRPLVIVVQSDHGIDLPRPGGGADKAVYARHKHSILSAVYYSNGLPAEAAGSRTPVNTFRVLFDRYFGTSLGLLPDRAYYSVTEQWPYWPTEVTSQMTSATTGSAPGTRTAP
jgi:hypothetical protein